MAERYAVATGLWTAATFDGGTLPGVGDTVHANGYIVTIDQAITVAALSNRVGSIASAGGTFRVSSPGIVINADIYAGTEYTLSFTGASTSLTFNGDVFGSDTTGNAYAIYHNGTNLLVINGDVRGGSASSAIAVLVSSSGDINLFGDIYGGTAAGGSCHGLRFTGTGICSSFECLWICCHITWVWDCQRIHYRNSATLRKHFWIGECGNQRDSEQSHIRIR
jgi:hypothetical protein